MAVLQRASELQSDAPPLWLPRHDAEVVDQAAARPPDTVDGYSAQSTVTAAVLGSQWKMATLGAMAVALVAFFALVPSLLSVGIGTMLKMAFYQAWTVGLLLAVTTRVRSISIGSVVRYWLAGLFTAVLITSFVGGAIGDVVEPGATWVAPALEELLKAAVLGVAVFMGRRAWRHPGVSDMLILGFAVGGGFAFHEEALWERGAVSGFDLNIGFFVPSVFRPDGLLVAGHGVWTALIGAAIALLILHRRQAFAAVGGVVVLLMVVADRMALNDVDGSLDVVRQLLFNGKLIALVFLAAVVGSLLLDQRRLATTAVRDHLFPSTYSHAAIDDPDADIDPVKSLLVGRYRRLRNGMHTTANATTQHWPPRSEAHAAPVAELARLGRAADIAVGPGTSPSGWAPDPETPDGYRFVGPAGFTAYAAGNVIVEPAATLPEMPDVDVANLDETALAAYEHHLAEAAKQQAQASLGPTTTSISVPRARVEATGTTRPQRPSDFLQYAGLSVLGVGLFTLVRLMTASDASSAVLESPFSLADATNSPALIITAVGAIAAAVAIRGRDNAELGAGWEVGPGRDPSPNRTDECQA